MTTDTNPFDDDRDDTASGGRPDGLNYTAPHDQDAEEAVLGAMLLNRKVIDDIGQIVKGKHYYRPAHELIHNTIMELHGAGEVADPITVSAALLKSGELVRAGGAPYLHRLVAAVPTAANGEYYAEIVRERFVARDFAQATMRATQNLLSGAGDPKEIIADIQAQITAVEAEQAEEGLHLIAESMEGTLDFLEAIAENKGKLTGVPTGFNDLDALTQGWQGGQFIIVAARPAMGKSTIANDFLRACSIKHNLPSVIFSLEMSRNEINMRMLSAEARVGLHNMRAGVLEDDDWTRIARRMPDVTGAPLYIDDSPNLDLSQIRAKARRLKEKQGLKLIVIDYLQLLGSGSNRRFESRQVEVSYISRSLKLLAKELDVPIIALAQLNRGPELRAEKIPMVSDLRESGSLEQDADLVILLHREDAYEKTSPRAGEADVIVGKHRNGATATITVAFQGHYSRFVDMTRE
ncbi:replicative DNA helicase [Streptomyces sp. CB03911]|uniref:replicative DNA helicase n=1 Tax=Streptomyces sp. CB03911 TaxID=1804758 RepID=UPI00093B6258|nr:replicative DNA helicase [Streptomyces sp. CB03911]OKI16596.1 replicative DNA helicase [Streptomyces sp. CB03911]